MILHLNINLKRTFKKAMNRLITILIMVFYYYGSRCQSFYDINTIQNINIVFTQNNWDYMLDTATIGSNSYIMAQTITINGVVFDSVGVRYKGNSTYNASQVKNPFHIELDTYKNQDYQGYTDIKLSNVAKDPSFLREVLSYSILRQYMDAPLSNYANVTVNGNLIGLYVSSESVSKKFVNDHFYSKTNSFFKCNPIGGAGMGGTGKPNLVYLGTDSSLYYPAYEINSDGGWNNLIALCDTLAYNTNGIANSLDIDRALWMLAFDNVFVNLDSYIGGFSQNYYLYKSNHQQFNCVVWDLNESFGTFSQTGIGNLTSTTAKQQMNHLLHLNDANWPLVQKLLSVPIYKRMYIAHMRTILNENFANNSYISTAQSYQTIINNAVQADPNKFFSYAQYISNLTADVQSGNTNAPGITNLMNGRKNYLFSLADFTNLPPVITNISPTTNNPALNSTISISATVYNTNTNAVYLGYRYGLDAAFTRVLMYDDGLHGDGVANDSNYGAFININSTMVQYYIYAENNNAGIFSPERAEHEYYSIFAITPMLNPGDVVINEIMASNLTTAVDQDGEYDDWIELYNFSPNYISCNNLYLSDISSNPLKWKFPDNTVIAPNDYLIIWADNDTLQNGLHANFKLSASGEQLILSYPNGTIMDNLTFGLQIGDTSFLRCPNGTGPFIFAAPSFASQNCVATGIDLISSPSFVVYPNPGNGTFNLSSLNNSIKSVIIYNNMGQTVQKCDVDSRYNSIIDLSLYEDGLYLLLINGSSMIKIIKSHNQF